MTESGVHRRVPESSEDAFAEYLRLREAGEEVAFEDWVARHPAYAAELRDLHVGWRSFEADLGGLARIWGSSTAATRFHYGPPAGERRFGLGEEFGGHRIERFVGRGGMGEVWEALDVRLHRRVALKLIRQDRWIDRAERLFVKEARAAGRIDHPAIVTVYAVGKTEGQSWISQELVHGGKGFDTLVQVSARDDRPRDHFRRVASIVAEIAEGMHAAHRAGVVHRDLKPSNILLTPQGRPKVVDFGLARLMEDEPLTDSRGGGTPPYMSPEQTRGDAVDARTDVFSLGAVLYEALTGRRAFDGKTDSEVFDQVQRHEPPEPRSLDRRIPEDLAAITMGALEKSRADRFQTMQELADELRRFLNHEPLRLVRPGPAGRLRRWTQRHPARAWALGVTLVAVSALGAMWGEVQRTRRDETRARARELVAEARRDVDRGDLDAAAERVRRALELAPEDPSGHWVLAQGYQAASRIREMREHVALGMAAGFESDPARIDTPEEAYRCALSLLAEQSHDAYRRAEPYFVQATAGGLDTRGAWFSLYQIRLALGERAAALEALRQYRAQVRGVEEMATVIDALEAELTGDVASMREGLAEQRARDPEDDLRTSRVMGRQLLEEGRFADARAELQRAVEVDSTDYAAWSNLAMANAELYDEGADPEDLRGAEDAARRALAINADDELANEVMAHVEYWNRDWDALRRRLDRLDGLGLDTSNVEWIRAEALYAAALGPYGTGDVAEALDLATACVEADGTHVLGFLMRGNLRCETEPELALDDYLRALELWQVRDTDRRPERRYLHAIHVGVLMASSGAGATRDEAATDSLDFLEDELVARAEIDPIELMNLAHCLATTPLEWRDCDLARELVDGHGLRGRFGGDPTAAGMLREIDEGCP